MAIGTVWADDTWDDDAWADDTWADAEGPPPCTPPTNASFATATAIPSFPATITQSDLHCSGVTYTVYYKFTAPQTGLLSIFGWGGTADTGYQPSTFAYRGPAGGPTGLVFGDDNRPIQLQVESGVEYFLEFNTNSGNPTPAVLTIEASFLVQQAIPVGALLVNDDTEGFPLIALSGQTDFTVLASVPDIVAGEAGDALDSNTTLFGDEFNGELVTYDDAFNVINALDIYGPYGNFATPFIRNRNGEDFYVGIDRTVGDVVVRNVLPTGFFGTVDFELTGTTSLRAIAPANDGSILYYGTAGAGTALQRWDITNNVPLSDLAPGVPTYFIPDALVLPNGNVVATYTNLGDTFVRIYAPDGTVLAETPFDTEFPAFTLPRLSHSADREDFWVMGHGTATSIYRHFDADGNIIETITHYEFELGVYTGPQSGLPPRFGASFSCPLVVRRGENPGPGPGPEPEPEPPPDICPGGGLQLEPGSVDGNGCVQC